MSLDHSLLFSSSIKSDASKPRSKVTSAAVPTTGKIDIEPEATSIKAFYG